MEIPSFWHVQQPLSVKCERSDSSERLPEKYQFCDGNLNFSTATAQEDDDFRCSRKRAAHQMSRDPMSHRVIEKRRRDRMNNCLADLSRLIPADYLKKGRGRIEKTEIIEMAIKHMKYLQVQATKINSMSESSAASQSPTSQDEGTTRSSTPTPNAARSPSSLDGYRVGYQECVSETLHFMVEVEGFFAGDPLCLELVNHLQRHCDKVMAAGKRQSAASTHSSPSIYDQNQNNADTSSSSASSPRSSDAAKDSCLSSDQKDAKPYQEKKQRVPGPSQLRKMLTCPSMSLHHVDGPPSSHAGADPALYKFKNNIKQRFVEEHDGLKRGRFEVPGIKRRNSDSCTTASSLASPDLFAAAPCAFGVPIFALHATGSFYIPITVDSVILAPFLKELTRATEENQSYHPVTISVSFPQSLRMLRPHVKDMLVSKGMHGGANR